MAFIVIVCFPGCDINFENNLTFITRPKKLSTLKRKELSLKQIKQTFLEGESPILKLSRISSTD